MNAIETFDLVKSYRKKVVIDHVNLVIPEGSIFGFVGENGAGKTTIMRIVSGLANPTRGGYALYGVSNKDHHIYDERNKMAAIVEAPSLVPSMNAKDNLHFAALYLGVKEEIDYDALLTKVGLSDVANKKVKDFSLGMRQRLGIAMCLLNNPKLLLLDEPMNGLDPAGIAELRDLLIALNKSGITILVSSHILSELEKIATHYGIISHGKLIKTITIDELRSECQKALVVSVDNVDKLIKLVEKMGCSNYKLASTETLNIYDPIDVNSLAVAMVKDGISIKGIQLKDESIEDFYLNLLKEAK